jgi:hypothetical protein
MTGGSHHFDVAYPVYLLLLDETKTGMTVPTASGEQALAVITDLGLARQLCEIIAKQLDESIKPHAILGDAEALKHLHGAAGENIKQVLFFEPSGVNTLRHEISIESTIRTIQTAMRSNISAGN